MRKHKATHRRGQPLVMLISTVVALILASLPLSAPALADWQHTQKIDALSYKQEFGHWDIIDIPKEFKQNTIHAAELPTGKVLLVAGSGNNRDNFNSYNDNGDISVLATAIYDPLTNKIKAVPTPSDLFCSGHALLQTGNLLVAGGTSGYELLPGDVKKPAGTMVIHNENPDSLARMLKKGTKFISPRGQAYVSTQDVAVQPAMKMDYGQGKVSIMASSQTVFVEAVAADPSYVTTKNEQYKIEGLSGNDVHDIYGQGGPMTLNKQDFRGDNKAYEFDPEKEAYIEVGDMKESRWYPSLPVLTNGQVLAVSGLDNSGNITNTTEYYNPAEKTWNWGPVHDFPTYPALFRTKDPDVLFFSGSSSGYGLADKGRQPGFWNIKNNTFAPVQGLRDTNILETSASVALPPVKGSNDGSQDSRIMLTGGGGVGESPLSTARTDIIDLNDPNPRYTPGPNLPAPLRYLNLTVTPWDEVFANGGSTDYRAKEDSYSFKAFSINPSTNQLTPMADELVGRSYHSGSILLKDGRILVFGGDPLYGDKNNTTPGTFEQRIEIFTPPQFYRGTRPVLNGPDSQVAGRGDTIKFTTGDINNIQTGRLIPPSTTTHVTNTEQRSVGVAITKTGNTLTFTLPKDHNLLPNGWYMFFAVTKDGYPSVAKMIQIIR